MNVRHSGTAVLFVEATTYASATEGCTVGDPSVGSSCPESEPELAARFAREVLPLLDRLFGAALD